MNFQETPDFTCENTKQNCFIYFLIDKGEVVYVGQTMNGLKRPYCHTDKIYDTISVIYCDDYEINDIEAEYILKYKPKYNKSFPCGLSLMNVRDRIRECVGVNDFNLTHLKKIIKELNILPTDFNCKLYLRLNDYYRIESYVSALKY